MTAQLTGDIAPARAPRILAIADSDSYLKWGAATLATLTDVGELDLVLLRSPILPSELQRAAAVAGTPFESREVPVLTLRSLRSRLRTARPDVIVLSATGPVAELIIDLVARLGTGRSEHERARRTARTVAGTTPRAGRPALVGGLPGMSYPATLRALRFRAGQDLFVVHSARERREFAAVADQLELDLRIALAPLPFLPDRVTRAPARAGAKDAEDAEAAATASAPHPLTRVVFTPQAKMPVTRAHREKIVRALARLATERPEVDVVIKVRGRAGEAQTHREDLPFDTLLDELIAQGVVPPGAIRVATGPLADQLEPGSALVTVSSTAALESLAAGIPTLILEDFGVNERMLNAVFLGSGCLGSLDDLAAGRFGTPDPVWLEDNYLHGSASELADAVRELVQRGRSADLPHPDLARRPGVVLGRQRRRLVRTRLRSELPAGLLRVLTAPGRARRALRRGLLRAARRPRAGTPHPS
ncbi:DUF6716 putative glycosyltransferase [Sanguibacter sp. A247]|uniref:DUF6716 putative glycosyltransferase n=1 Tax=unclassified Sanguibacter TaxID=2645534 RepID=UPI003FD6EC41